VSPHFRGIATNQPVWIVTDPKPTSTLSDVVSNRTSLRAFVSMCRGGLREEECPALHTTYASALLDAMMRCLQFKNRFDELAEKIEAAYAYERVERDESKAAARAR